jgi:CRP-like cAMP-binding protein
MPKKKTKKPKTKSGETRRQTHKGRALENDILCSMPDKEWRAISPGLRFVEMPDHLELHKPHARAKYLYFPNSGLISLVIFMKDGRTAEAGIVGREGIVGLPGLMGFPKHALQEIVQISGNAFRISLSTFRKIAPKLPELHRLADRYSTSLGLQVAQTAACNRLHDLEQRLARWLLMAQDRVKSDSVAITQDFLATMLGTDRPSVTLAEGILEKAGAIGHSRGVVRIVDRVRLEAYACECYGLISRYAGGRGRQRTRATAAQGPSVAGAAFSAHSAGTGTLAAAPRPVPSAISE